MMEVLVLGDESAKCDVCVAPESEEGGTVCHLYLVADRRTSVETGYREKQDIQQVNERNGQDRGYIVIAMKTADKRNLSS